jgi:enoyl-CoA hydratase
MSLDIAISSNGVAEVVLNHPPVNAFTSDQLAELAQQMRSTGADPAVRVIILRGEGKGFCAGINLKQLVDDPAAVVQVNREAFAAFEAIHHCAVPVIAAVHGYALGAGLAMVGASDIILAAEDARLGLPEIDRGMLGGASHLLRMLPLHAVRRIYFSGEPITGVEAYRLGALDGIHPTAQLLAAARTLAGKIAGKSPRAIRYAKEALNGIEPVDLERNYRFEQGFTFELSHSRDAHEARAAFLEKRDPRFTSAS